MERQHPLTRFWLWLGYREDQLVTIDRAWFKERFIISMKSFYFLPLCVWYLVSGQPSKIGVLLNAVTSI